MGKSKGGYPQTVGFHSVRKAKRQPHLARRIAVEVTQPTSFVVEILVLEIVCSKSRLGWRFTEIAEVAVRTGSTATQGIVLGDVHALAASLRRLRERGHARALLLDVRRSQRNAAFFCSKWHEMKP